MSDSDSAISGLLILGIVGLTVWGISAVIGGEREGFVQFSDCREEVTLSSDTLQKYYKKFTCSYVRSEGGNLMGGTCVHVDLAGGLFSDGGECTRAYVYEKKPEVTCRPEFPYLGYDDKCYTEWDIGRVDTREN
jgi:hypothetical protein